MGQSPTETKSDIVENQESATGHAHRFRTVAIHSVDLGWQSEKSHTHSHLKKSCDKIDVWASGRHQHTNSQTGVNILQVLLGRARTNHTNTETNISDAFNLINAIYYESYTVVLHFNGFRKHSFTQLNVCLVSKTRLKEMCHYLLLHSCHSKPLLCKTQKKYLEEYGRQKPLHWFCPYKIS